MGNLADRRTGSQPARDFLTLSQREREVLKALLVTFSLRNLQKDYSQFFVALRGNVLQWWHVIEQTCVVYTHHDVQSLNQQLIPHIEATDSLLIVEIRPHQVEGWLPKSAWQWLNSVSEAVESKPVLPFDPWKSLGGQ